VYLWNRQSRSSILKLLGAGLIVVSPSLIVFGYLIGVAGFNSVAEGVVNYGSSSMVCPYWPTGLGLLGFLAGLSEGILLYILGALLSEGTTGKRRYRILSLRSLARFPALLGHSDTRTILPQPNTRSRSLVGAPAGCPDERCCRPDTRNAVAGRRRRG
jgi:hypothetical protein